MSAVRDWLEAQGLGEYADLFERERINLDIVGDLKEADLEKLGIALSPRSTAGSPKASTPTA